MEHELNIIKTFVTKERQQRYINLISTKKGRAKFRLYIAHFQDIDKHFCSLLTPSIKIPNNLLDLLKSKGAPDICYIISENSKYDQKELQLQDAVNKLFHSGIAYFLSCIPGNLAYYEGEDLNSCYVLEKN
jgi:hypothetical protein